MQVKVSNSFAATSFNAFSEYIQTEVAKLAAYAFIGGERETSPLVLYVSPMWMWEWLLDMKQTIRLQECWREIEAKQAVVSE